MKYSLLTATLVAAGTTAFAQAGLVLNFDSITNNSAESTAIAESQISVSVADQGGGMVLFTFNNVGMDAAVIAEIYFDSDILTGITNIDNSDPGVDFEDGRVMPPDLPAGNTVGFMQDFATEASNPAPSNGVGPGETLGLTVGYTGTFMALSDALVNGTAVIGIHVVAFDNGESESLVTPAPGAIALLGLAGLVGTRRRRTN